MTDYISVHGSMAFRDSSFLRAPIPPSGVPGSLSLYSIGPKQYRVGDKITVTTAGQKYTYYSTSELLTGYASSYLLPVLPAIQATHSNGDVVETPYEGYLKTRGMNAITVVNCNSADVSAPDQRRSVVPYVRAWPWATDPYGLSWDQSSIMAVSTIPMTSAIDFDDPTAGQSYTIPVPRAIGAEYTHFSQRSLGLTDGYYVFERADYPLVQGTEYRDATSQRSRYSLPNLRWDWRAKPQIFSTVNADADDTIGSEIVETNGPQTITNWPTAWQRLVRMTGDVPQTGIESGGVTTGAFGVGCRGGRYSFCGYGGDTSGYCGYTIEIRAIMPGLGDILIHSVTGASSGSFPGFGAVVTGTWSGVVIPTDASGTPAQFYLKAIANTADPFNSVRLTHGSNVVIATSTQVPWHYHIITGNDNAPGGLIAPFY